VISQSKTQQATFENRSRQPGAHTSPFSALGFQPRPDACITKENTAISQRLVQETIAANQIRRLVLHGLRKEKSLVYTISWRIEVKRRARRDRAARIVVQAFRMMQEFLDWRAHDRAMKLQLWWRKCMFLIRCERRVRSAIEARREAQIKRLAASMMLSTARDALRRIGFERLRIAALLGRWEDDRFMKRQMGLVPRFDILGRRKVQVLLPEGGPEVIRDSRDLSDATGMDTVARGSDSIVVAAGHARTGQVRALGSIDQVELQRVMADAKKRMMSQQQHSVELEPSGPASIRSRPAYAADGIDDRITQAAARLRPTSPSRLVKGPDGIFRHCDDPEASLWVEGGQAATLGVRSAVDRELAYRRGK